MWSSAARRCGDAVRRSDWHNHEFLHYVLLQRGEYRRAAQLVREMAAVVGLVLRGDEAGRGRARNDADAEAWAGLYAGATHLLPSRRFEFFRAAVMAARQLVETVLGPGAVQVHAAPLSSSSWLQQLVRTGHHECMRLVRRHIVSLGGGVDVGARALDSSRAPPCVRGQ